MFPCSKALRVDIDIIVMDRTENAFNILKFLFLADIFEIKLPKEGEYLKSMTVKLSMKTDVCLANRLEGKAGGK